MTYDRVLYPPRIFSPQEFTWIVNNITPPLPQTVAQYIPDVAAKFASTVADKVMRLNAAHYVLLWNTIGENNFQNRYFYDSVRNTGLFIAMEMAKNTPDAWEAGVNKSVTVTVSGLCNGIIDPNFRNMVVAQTNDPNFFAKADNNQQVGARELQAVEQQLANSRPNYGAPPNYPMYPNQPRSAPAIFNAPQSQLQTEIMRTYASVAPPQPPTPPPQPVPVQPLEWGPSFEQPFRELVLLSTCQTKLVLRNGKPYEEIEIVDREKHRLYQESPAVAPYVKMVDNAELISGILALEDTDGRSAVKVSEVVGETSLEASIRLLRVNAVTEPYVGILIAPVLLHTPIFVKKHDDPTKILKALSKQTSFSDIARRLSALYNLPDTEVPQSGFSSRENLKRFIEEIDRKLTDYINQVLLEIHISTLPLALFIDSFMSDMFGDGSLQGALSRYDRNEGHSRYTLAYNEVEKKAAKLLIDGYWPGQEGSFNLDPIAHMEEEGGNSAGVGFLRTPTIIAMTSITSHDLMLQGVRNTPLNINKEGVPTLFSTVSAIYREDVVKDSLIVYLLTSDGGLYKLHQLLNNHFVIQRT